MVHSLPVFLTPLIGRAGELATLEQLLRHTGVRLVTLTGPGGVGKTRLAVAAASIVGDDYPGAINFISLVPITEPEFVWPAIVAALGIHNGEASGHAALERIARFIHEKPYLLILDNFEHIIEAASGLTDLLVTCPNLKIMVTSRQNLGVRGEQEFAVPLLGLPDMDRLDQGVDLAAILPRYPAVQLFLERMRAIQVDYEPDQEALRAIAALCVRLDGIPLAIELAAPLTRMFSPDQLLTQLEGQGGSSSLRLLTGGARDMPARQRTIRRTIQWSYDLLPEDEQRVFRTASVFAGTFSLTEAEKVLHRSSDKELEPPLTNVMAALIEKNLIIRQVDAEAEARFRLLDVLQAFGRAEVARLGEKPRLHAAHAAAFLELAETAVPNLYTYHQVETTARLRREADNLRLALRWALEKGELEMAVRFGAALWRFWLLSGLLNEGQGWLKEILAHLGFNLESAETGQLQNEVNSLQPSEVGRVAELLYGLGNLAYRRSGSRRPEEIRCLSHSLDLYLRIGDQVRAALAQTVLTRAILSLSLHEDLDVAQRQLEDSFEILKAAGHKIGMAENLHAQARNFFYLNDPNEASRAMGQSLDLFRETGNVYGLAQAIKVDGELAFGRVGSYAELRRTYDEAAEIFTALGNVTEAAVAKSTASVLTSLLEGDWKSAQAIVEKGRQVAREHSNERAATLCKGLAAWIYASLGSYAEAKSLALEAIRAAFTLSDQDAIRVAFIGLANAERLAGDLTAAVATISALVSYRTHYKSLSYTRGNSLHLTSLSQLHEQLDPAAFAHAWSLGPLRLAEWLHQSDSERINWPLAPVPEVKSTVASRGMNRGISSNSRVADNRAPDFPEALTERERDVLKYLIEGLTDTQIAEALVISPRTVHAHLRNIYGKLGVNSRTAATRLALEKGLL